MKYKKALPTLLILGVAALAGCRRHAPPAPADPDKAREVLQTTLTAWQKGESADSLRRQWPAITAVDPKWKSGHRLVRYEIADNHEVVGSDVQCRALLVLEPARGKQLQEKAVFRVSTSPALVVVRTEE
jgi:hypothetical protein